MNSILDGKLDYSSSLTLQDQLLQIIKSNIVSSKMEVGSKLPTEEEICKAYDISRSTVRAAIYELEKDGLIARVRGKGTFVSNGKMKRKMEKVYSFSHQMEMNNKKPTSKVLEFTKVEATPELAKIFELPMNSMLYNIKRIRYADKVPLLVETTYIPVTMYPKLEIDNIENKSLYDSLRNEAGIIPYEAEEVYESVVMKNELCKLLECPHGSSGFRIERVAKIENGTVYEFTQSYMRGDCSKLSITLREDNYFFSREVK